MFTPIPQSTAFRVLLRAFTSRNRTADELGQTLVVQISKNGAMFGTPSGGTAATEIGNGWYYKDLTTTDTGTLGPLAIRATGTNIFPIEPQPVYVRKATNLDMTALPDVASAAAGGLATLIGACLQASGYTAPDNTDIATLVSRLTSGRASNLDNLDAAISTRATAAAVWAVLTSTLTTASTIGKLLVDDIDAAISSRSTYGGVDTSGTTTLLARLTSTRAGLLDHLNADMTSRAVPGDAMTLTSAYDAAKTAAQAGDAMALTSGERSTLATAIWSAGTRTLTSFGTLVADIWAGVVDSSGVTTLLALLTSGRAANLDNLDATVSSRLATSGYTAPDNTDIAAIKAKTDFLPADPAATSDLANLDVAVSTRLASADTDSLVDDIWEELLADHTTSGTMGHGMNVADVGGGGGSIDYDQVKDKVVEALALDDYDLPGQEDLPAPTNLAYMLSWLYKLNRNRLGQTNDLTRVYNDAETSVDQKAAITKDETTFIRHAYSSGP